MTELEREMISETIKDFLRDNSNMKFKEIKPRLQLSTKEDLDEAKKIFNNISNIKLSYNDRKNGCIKIPKITDELTRLVNDNQLDFNSDCNLVLLTKHNSKIIESLINNDPDYFPFSKTLFDSFGKENVKKNKNRALFAVLREIDRDNSTNVWRYKKNRSSFNKLLDYILDDKNDFYKKLEQGNRDLPDELCERCGDGLKSFSSKVCKYLCEFSDFKDGHNDNYYINDSYIRHALLFYLDFYGVDRRIGDEKIHSSRTVDHMSYKNIFHLLEELNNKREKKHDDGKLSRSELDHIIWYCYKSFVI